MISVLIPIYNFDVCRLVQTIHQQGEQLTVPFEIICVDDASDEDFWALNSCIDRLAAVRLERLSQNMGRSKIRNYLATLARYEYLLYMDCDSMPISEEFLSNYVINLAPNQLLYGGRVYQKEPPSERHLLFHWRYGSVREATTAKERRKFPYQSFMTNNFVVPKAILEQIKFDETLIQYGHEDTLFGLELKQREVPIMHLDNPLMHIGLERGGTFLQKTEKGIENLFFLQQKYDLGTDIKLLRYYLLLKRWKLNYLLAFCFYLFKPLLRYNLYSSRPSLFIFDLYKLGVLLQQKKLLNKH